MDIATLGLEIRSDGVVVAKDRLKDFEGHAGRAERSTISLTNAFRALRPVVGAVMAAFSVRALKQYTDTWTDLTSRVNLAAGSMEQGTAVMGRLEEMARRTYSSLGQTVESYLGNATALRELGLSTEQALDFTESLNNAMVVSGARAERAASIQNALAQAMALGELRGQQLNTVIQNGGRVAELLAAELGVNVNQLRALGAEGEITGDVIQRALIGNLELLRDEADSMPATIGDAFTLMGNSVLGFVGRVDQAVGASEALASSLIGLADSITSMTEPAIAGISLLADNFDRVLFYAVGFATFMGVQYVAQIGFATAATAGLSAALRVLRGAIAGTGIGLLVLLATDVVYRIYDATVGVQDFGEALEGVTEPGRTLFEFLDDGFKMVFALADWASAGFAAFFVGAFATIHQRYAQFVNFLRDGFVGLFGRDIAIGVGLNPDYRVNESQFVDMANRLGQDRDNAFGRAQHYFDRLINGRHQDYDLGPDDIADQWKRFNDAGGAALSDLTDKTNALSGSMGGASTAIDAANDNLLEMGNIGQQVTSTLANGFTDLFMGLIDGSKSAGQAIADLLSQLGRLLLNQAFQILFGGLRGGFNPLGFLFGGFRADGGPVAPGVSYIVGERGPELFTPTMPGNIVPNHAVAANRNTGAANHNMKVELTVKVDGARGSKEIEESVAVGVAQGLKTVEKNIGNLMADWQIRYG